MVAVPEEITRCLHAVTARVRDVFGDHVVLPEAEFWSSRTSQVRAVTASALRIELKRVQHQGLSEACGREISQVHGLVGAVSPSRVADRGNQDRCFREAPWRSRQPSE